MMLADAGGAVGAVSTNTIVASLLELSTNVITFVMDNPLLLIMFSGSLVGVACYVVRKIKRTARA